MNESAAAPDRDEILLERARELAAPVGEDEHEDRLEVVEFALGEERYGLELPLIREVRPLGAVTRVPCTPSFVFGVLNVRGRVVSVIDLAPVLELPPLELGDDCHVLILGSGSMEFGIVSDRVTCVRSVEKDSLQPGLPSLAGKRAEYTKGVTGDGLAVLDGERILEDETLIIHEEVEA